MLPPQKPAAQSGKRKVAPARPPVTDLRSETVLQPASAGFRERLGMAWEMTWPLALLDLAVILLIHGVMDTQTETLDSVWAVIGFFGASPWVVRRALARSYGNIRVAVVAQEQDRARLTYQQSLKVMWLLAWRSTVLALAGLLVLSALLRAIGLQSHDLPVQGPLVNALGLAAVDAITSLIFFPFLIPGMVRKRYRDFHLELRSTARK